MNVRENITPAALHMLSASQAKTHSLKQTRPNKIICACLNICVQNTWSIHMLLWLLPGGGLYPVSLETKLRGVARGFVRDVLTIEIHGSQVRLGLKWNWPAKKGEKNCIKSSNGSSKYMGQSKARIAMEDHWHLGQQRAATSGPYQSLTRYR